MVMRKRKSAKRKTGRTRTGAWETAKAKRATRLGKVRRRVRAARRPKDAPVPVQFAKTGSKRIRFILPSGKWSRSYANRGAARRGACRIYKAKVTSQRAAA